MKSSYFQPTLFTTLITLCIPATLSAQPGENTKPEARQAPVTHPDLKLFPPAKTGMERFVISTGYLIFDFRFAD